MPEPRFKVGDKVAVSPLTCGSTANIATVVDMRSAIRSDEPCYAVKMDFGGHTFRLLERELEPAP